MNVLRSASLKNFGEIMANSPFLSRRLDRGYSIGRLVVSLWSSQKNPPKVYPLGRRLHHGEIGLVGLVISTLASNPGAMGFFKALVDDDLPDREEWFAFKKRIVRDSVS